MRCECCLNVVWNTPEHLIGSEETPKSIQKEAKRAPRDTEEQPRAPEVRPREPPRAPKRKPRELSRARRPNVSFRSRMINMKIKLPPRRGHDFRCQRRGEGRTSFHFIFGAQAGPLEIPWVLRCAQKTLAMIKSTCLETIYCFSSRLISVKPHRTDRYTRFEPSSKRFSAPKPTRRASKTTTIL